MLVCGRKWQCVVVCVVFVVLLVASVLASMRWLLCGDGSKKDVCNFKKKKLSRERIYPRYGFHQFGKTHTALNYSHYRFWSFEND